MKIEGEFKLAAPADLVWKKVLDPEVLARVTPGIKTLEEQAEDHYKAISEVKVGPVRGSFEGDLFIKEKEEGKRCAVVLDQKSKLGNVLAEIGMELIPVTEAETLVKYTGEARISGMLARMGQRVLGGVVKTLAKQFFVALEQELH